MRNMMVSDSATIQPRASRILFITHYFYFIVLQLFFMIIIFSFPTSVGVDRARYTRHRNELELLPEIVANLPSNQFLDGEIWYVQLNTLVVFRFF